MLVGSLIVAALHVFGRFDDLMRAAYVALRRFADGLGLRCRWTGRSWPVRTHLGLRCARCSRALADYEDAGLLDSAYIPSYRRIFERAHGGTVTRTDAWTESRRGW
jgi:hypothetical protein